MERRITSIQVPDENSDPAGRFLLSHAVIFNQIALYGKLRGMRLFFIFILLFLNELPGEQAHY